MISLAPLTGQDGEALAQIHRTCFPDAWDKDTFETLLQENLTCGWMARSGDKEPVGFILARGVSEEAEILTFAVKPGFQRQGVGRLLLTTVMAFLTSISCKTLFLEVAVDNEAARALYTSLGFREIGKRPHYYQRPNQTFVSASVMACSLRAITPAS